MPAPSKKNVIEWLGPYLKHQGLDVDWAASEIAKKIKGANSHNDVDRALKFVDHMVNGHGIEAIRSRNYRVDSYYDDIVALYVNMGDSYNATLLYATDTERFILTSWGDWVERNQRKYDII